MLSLHMDVEDVKQEGATDDSTENKEKQNINHVRKSLSATTVRLNTVAYVKQPYCIHAQCQRNEGWWKNPTVNMQLT